MKRAKSQPFVLVLLLSFALIMLPVPATISASPMLQDAYLRVTNVSLNGAGSTVEGEPGQSITISFDYQLWNPDAMAGSINQIVVGIDETPQYCAYNGIPGRSPGQRGHSIQDISAPSQPGTYRLIADREAQYSCADAMRLYKGPKTTFGTIVVRAISRTPAPRVRVTWHLPNSFAYDQPARFWVTVCNDGGDANHRTNGRFGGSGTGEGNYHLASGQCADLGWKDVDGPRVTDQYIQDNQVCIYHSSELTNSEGRDSYADTRSVPVVRAAPPPPPPPPQRVFLRRNK